MQHRHHLTEQARAVATALVQHDGFARGGCAVGASRAGAALSRARAHGGRAEGLNVAAAHNKRCDDDVVEVKRQQFTAWHVTAIIDARAQTVREQCWILDCQGIPAFAESAGGRAQELHGRCAAPFLSPRSLDQTAPS